MHFSLLVASLCLAFPSDADAGVAQRLIDAHKELVLQAVFPDGVFEASKYVDVVILDKYEPTATAVLRYAFQWKHADGDVYQSQINVYLDSDTAKIDRIRCSDTRRVDLPHDGPMPKPFSDWKKSFERLTNASTASAIAKITARNSEELVNDALILCLYDNFSGTDPIPSTKTLDELFDTIKNKPDVGNEAILGIIGEFVADKFKKPMTKARRIGLHKFIKSHIPREDDDG